MDSRVSLQPAYVLHRLAFQNTSLLVDFFTLDFGKVRAVAKGARSAKSKYRPLVQLFHPVLVSFSGRSEMKTLTGIESSVCAMALQGERLFSGLYVNELLVRLLHNHVEHEALYKNYQDTLIALQGSSGIEVILRRFELNLLAELGYGINLDSDCLTHAPIDESVSYRFTPDIGFEQVSEVAGESASSRVFRGEHIIALREFALNDKSTAKSAKKLLRMALGAHLGEKPLMSRSLFAHKT